MNDSHSNIPLLEWFPFLKFGPTPSTCSHTKHYLVSGEGVKLGHAVPQGPIPIDDPHLCVWTHQLGPQCKATAHAQRAKGARVQPGQRPSGPANHMIRHSMLQWLQMLQPIRTPQTQAANHPEWLQPIRMPQNQAVNHPEQLQPIGMSQNQAVNHIEQLQPIRTPQNQVDNHHKQFQPIRMSFSQSGCHKTGLPITLSSFSQAKRPKTSLPITLNIFRQSERHKIRLPITRADSANQNATKNILHKKPGNMCQKNGASVYFPLGSRVTVAPSGEG